MPTVDLRVSRASLKKKPLYRQKDTTVLEHVPSRPMHIFIYSEALLQSCVFIKKKKKTIFRDLPDSVTPQDNPSRKKLMRIILIIFATWWTVRTYMISYYNAVYMFISLKIQKLKNYKFLFHGKSNRNYL